MEDIEFSLVIPAYNEAGRLQQTLQQAIAALDAHRHSWEILVVDDGSTDNTCGVARQTAGGDHRIQVLTIPHGGKGAAVRHGMLAARGRWRFMADADFAVDLGQLPKFLSANADMAIGSREAPGAQRIGEPFVRHLIGRLFNLFVQLVAVRGIEDTQCGYKLFSHEAARQLFGASRLRGLAFDVEVLFLARRAGFSVREVPVTWHHRAGSRVRPQTGLAAFGQILQIRWNAMRGRYDALLSTPARTGRARLVGWAVATPPLVLATFALLLGLGTPGVETWFWPEPDTNIVEAALLRDVARVRMLAAQNQSLNGPRAVRPQLLDSSTPPMMTPLEAAVRAQDDSVVEVVLELGASPRPDEARRLQCLALDQDNNDAARRIGEAFGVPATCE